MNTLVVDIGEKKIKALLFSNFLNGKTINSNGIENGIIVDKNKLEESLNDLIFSFETANITQIGFCFSFSELMNMEKKQGIKQKLNYGYIVNEVVFFEKNNLISEYDYLTIPEIFIDFLKTLCIKWQKNFLFCFFSPCISSDKVVVDLGASETRVKISGKLYIIKQGTNNFDGDLILIGNTEIVQKSRRFLRNLLTEIVNLKDNIYLSGTFYFISFIEFFLNNQWEKKEFKLWEKELLITSNENSNTFVNCIEAYSHYKKYECF